MSSPSHLCDETSIIVGELTEEQITLEEDLKEANAKGDTYKAESIRNELTELERKFDRVICSPTPPD